MMKWLKSNRKAIAIAVIAALVLLFVFIQAPGFIKKEKPPVSITGEYPERKSGESINVAEMQRSVNTAASLRGLGPDTKFLIVFYDSQGRQVAPRFMISEGGLVTEITGFTLFDVAIATGDWYMNEIKSTNDICGLWKRLKANGELTIQTNVDATTLQSRYGTVSSDCIALA